MSKSFIVELSRLGSGDPMGKPNRVLERDRLRFMVCRGLEDLGYQIENNVVKGQLTPEEERILDLLIPTLANQTLGIPADVLVRVQPLGNTFKVNFLY